MQYAQRFARAGSYRRGKGTIGDLDVIMVPKTELHLKDLVAHAVPMGMTYTGDKLSCVLSNEVTEGEGRTELEIWLSTPESFINKLWFRTGSAQFNIKMACAARRQGWLLNQHHLCINRYAHPADRRVEHFDSEESLFSRLGVKFVLPEHR
tara:strand:- start:1665 stop:2117 length:453 start_codon:yes stop_codon:yes gene_type:complete